MNYWTEMGWIILLMNVVELGFTFVMCFVAYWLDNRKS